MLMISKFISLVGVLQTHAFLTVFRHQLRNLRGIIISFQLQIHCLHLVINKDLKLVHSKTSSRPFHITPTPTLFLLVASICSSSQFHPSRRSDQKLWCLMFLPFILTSENSVSSPFKEYLESDQFNNQFSNNLHYYQLDLSYHHLSPALQPTAS